MTDPCCYRCLHADIQFHQSVYCKAHLNIMDMAYMYIISLPIPLCLGMMLDHCALLEPLVTCLGSG